MGQAAVKTTRKNAIAGFYPEKIDGETIRRFVEKSGIEIDVDKDSTAEQVAVALTLHFRKTTSEDDMCKCESCGGEAPDSYETCPFCGLEGEAGDDVVEPTASSPEVEETADDEEETEGEGGGDDEGGDETPPPEPEAKSKGKKEDRGMTTKAMTKSNGAAATVSKGAEVVELKPGGKVSEKDLDAAVRRVIDLKVDSATSYYALCREILEINKRGLWKLRKDANGKVKYSGFDAFCEQELHMSSANAFGMMKTARELTADDVAAMGRSKAILVLKAAPADRKKLAEKAKSGATARELKKDVAESRKKTGFAGDTDAAKRGAKGGKKRAEKIEKGTSKLPPQDKITVAKIEGLRTIKLYARPASLKNLDLDACKRASTNAAIAKWIETVQPFGKIELTNGVVMYASIGIGKDGNAVAKIDTRRESPAAE